MNLNGGTGSFIYFFSKGFLLFFFRFRMVHEAAQPRSKQHTAMKAAKARREELHKHQQQASTHGDGADPAPAS